jgi:phosphatidylserine/phosphatidylglycerophosphate/cardiolipin synthase-like enzyme
MSNVEVKGKLTDELGAGLSDVRVDVFDIDLLDFEDRLGQTYTMASGEFSVTYDPSAYGWLEKSPDLVVRMYDPVGRLLYESPEYSNITEAALDLGQIIVPQDVLRGWLVTLRQGYSAATPTAPSGNPYPLFSQGNLVKPLVDNEAAWLDLTRVIQNARRFIHVTQLWFNVGRLFTVFNPPAPIIGSSTSGTRLEEILLAKNRSQGVKVQLLLNDVQLDPGLFDSISSVQKYYDAEQAIVPHTVEVRGFPRPYNNPLHGKFAVIDGKTAYIIGSPFIQGYHDGQSHRIDDPRRGVKSFFEHTDASPLHDVSAAIEGPAVEAVNETFLALWNRAGSATGRTAHQPPAAPNASVQIVRTLPANLLPSAPQGETGILEAYLRAIREAHNLIFLDNQYFTEPIIANALVSALKINPNLQVIMVINGRVDIPFYNSLQPNQISNMLASLSPSERARIGLFTMWSHETQRIIRIYTHAKVGVVDDRWATIGSANLDGVSLHLSQHTIPPISKRDRLESRGIELNALIFNGVDGLPNSPVPDELRRTLWAEYLGYSSANDPDLLNQPPGGWLALWQNHAAAKLNGLRTTPSIMHPARILEWRSEADPKKHLLALGLSRSAVSSLTVETAGQSFNFKTGQWE